MKTTIIYWSSTGNTAKIAQLIGNGLTEVAVDIAIKKVSESSYQDVEGSDIVLLGCSAMGVEEIDTSEMEPFIKANKEAFDNKRVALFGSYGWGDGEWMQEWETMMSNLGASIVVDSLTINEMPEGDSELRCIEFGKDIGTKLAKR